MLEQEPGVAVLRVSGASTALAVKADEVRRMLRAGELAGYQTPEANGGESGS